jgi:mRNA-degrading endonuclease RelE of RelBE toxin-antitoxin system
MNILISEFAQKELNDGIFYYELQLQGLGLQFKSEVRESINRIKKTPNVWPQEKGEVRKYLLHKFPYKILYSVQEQNIIILAIGHQHRKPGYWIEEADET